MFLYIIDFQYVIGLFLQLSFICFTTLLIVIFNKMFYLCIDKTLFMKILMKYFGLVILIALIACNPSDNEYDDMCNILHQVETIYQHPDGERYDSKICDTINHISELTKTIAFFAEKGPYDKAAQGSLYCGYAQLEKDDKVSAMKLFKNAEHYANLSGDSLTMARAQFNIARLLFYEKTYNCLLETASLANINFGKHYAELAYLNNLIALSYIIQKEYSNAQYYLDKALADAKEGQSSRATGKILNNYSVFYREQGKYDDAINCLLQMKELITDSTQLTMYNLNIGIIYVYSDNYDSAAYYIHKALDIAEVHKVKPETKVSIYFFLYYILKKQGDFQQSLEYHEKHESLQYQIVKENETKNLYRIQQQYDYEVLQNTMNQKIINRQRIILIISLLLLVISIVAIVLLVRQKNILKENKEIKQELDKTKDELQKSLRPEVVKEELSRQLHLIITANRTNNRANDYIKEWGPLVYKINNEKDTMFEAAVAAIERMHPNMYTVLCQKYPQLNDTESKVLLLSCSDLTNTEIGYILGLSVHSVNKSRSEIRRKIVK